MGRIVFVFIAAIAMVFPSIGRSEMTSTNFLLDAEPFGVAGRWVESAQFNLYSTIGMPPVVFVSLISTPGGYSLRNGVDTSLVYLALAPSNADIPVVPLMQGWNLVGNSSVGSLDVVSQLGDASKITTVWKWNANQSKWAFYAPSMTEQALADYAASKGYDVLATIGSGEGYWVNSKVGFTAPLPAGTAVASASFQTMGAGWNLISTGDNMSPREFNNAIGWAPPAVGEIPTNVTTLWAWDPAQSNWYFYAPSLDKSGGLVGYIVSKGYLDFGTKVLDQTMGFWVNKSAADNFVLPLLNGWNLVGNSFTGAFDVANAFGDAAKVTTVWKWAADSAKWAFYTPSMVGQSLVDYTSGKGYDVLTTINGGEGFWVNAKTAFNASLPSGTLKAAATFQTIGSGWNLIAIGENQTPSTFNRALSATPPPAGTIPQNVTTLWAWDSGLSNWYFYAPALDASSSLSSYITSKGYLDFTTAGKTLGQGVGFWINKP